MKRLLILIPALLLAGCATTTPQTDTTTTGTDTAISVQTGASQIVEDTKPVDVKPAADEYRIITVDAKRWAYSPNVITVKKGEKVKLKINNVDTEHGAEFETMKVQTDKDGFIVLDTSTAGTYVFKCAEYCGEGHKDMKGTVIVE